MLLSAEAHSLEIHHPVSKLDSSPRALGFYRFGVELEKPWAISGGNLLRILQAFQRRDLRLQPRGNFLELFCLCRLRILEKF